MRDPKRIEVMLDLIRRAWYLDPDMRLGQLLVNATGITGDMFYVEDYTVQEALARFARLYANG